jgi:hypothetical protein
VGLSRLTDELSETLSDLAEFVYGNFEIARTGAQFPDKLGWFEIYVGILSELPDNAYIRYDTLTAENGLLGRH